MSVVDHLQSCRDSHTRKSIRVLLQPQRTAKVLEDLGMRPTEYRTLIYRDSTCVQHLRVLDTSAHKQILRSFVKDMQQGYFPYMAEEHAENFPMYLQLIVSADLDIYRVCRTLHLMVLACSRQSVQSYCFAAERRPPYTAGAGSKPWRMRFLRMHWPLLLVSAKGALVLRECVVQAAMALFGRQRIFHIEGWEMQYHTPLSMIGCGGRLVVCPECRNSHSKRKDCPACSGMGTRIMAQPLWPVLVLQASGDPHWEDQRKLGVVGMHSWDLRQRSSQAACEMLEYLSVRALLPPCRYHTISPAPAHWCPPAPPMCPGCSLPISGAQCPTCRKAHSRRIDRYKKYTRADVPLDSAKGRVIADMVSLSPVDPYLFVLARRNQRHQPADTDEAPLRSIGLSFLVRTADQAERESSIASYVMQSRRQGLRSSREHVRKAEMLLDEIRGKRPDSSHRDWFRYTRVVRIEEMFRRNSSVVEKYVAHLGGLCSAYCPLQCVAHSEAGAVEIVRDEGCRYRCGDVHCASVYPAVKTTLFLKHRRMLFGCGTERSGQVPMPVSARDWRNSETRKRIMQRLLETYDVAGPVRKKVCHD